jgi:hypothetical protein
MSLSDYALSYQVSPITLVGGVAGTGTLPIVSLLNPSSYSAGLLSSSTPQQIADYFGQFRVISGHTLIDNEIATYPFANQVTAANAIITSPLQVSLEMLVPATGVVTAANKLSVITALQSSLSQHTALGGYYNVATPSFIYNNCLLKTLVDATDDLDGGQVQVRWIWTFVQPLLTAAALQAAQNQAMSTISGQTVNSGDPPGSQPIVTGISNPASNLAPSVVPAAANPVATNVAPAATPTTINKISSVSPIAPGG